MTPKEKAEEFVRRYYSLISGMELSYISKLIVFPSGDSHFETAKESALIVVGELIKCISSINSRPPNYQTIDEYCEEYWQEVKQEIERI